MKKMGEKNGRYSFQKMIPELSAFLYKVSSEYENTLNNVQDHFIEPKVINSAFKNLEKTLKTYSKIEGLKDEDIEKMDVKELWGILHKITYYPAKFMSEYTDVPLRVYQSYFLNVIRTGTEKQVKKQEINELKEKMPIFPYRPYLFSKTTNDRQTEKLNKKSDYDKKSETSVGSTGNNAMDKIVKIYQTLDRKTWDELKKKFKEDKKKLINTVAVFLTNYLNSKEIFDKGLPPVIMGGLGNFSSIFVGSLLVGTLLNRNYVQRGRVNENTELMQEVKKLLGEEAERSQKKDEKNVGNKGDGYTV
jgi:hypothetical protein